MSPLKINIELSNGKAVTIITNRLGLRVPLDKETDVLVTVEDETPGEDTYTVGDADTGQDSFGSNVYIGPTHPRGVFSPIANARLEAEWISK